MGGRVNFSSWSNLRRANIFENKFGGENLSHFSLIWLLEGGDYFLVGGSPLPQFVCTSRLVWDKLGYNRISPWSALKVWGFCGMWWFKPTLVFIFRPLVELINDKLAQHDTFHLPVIADCNKTARNPTLAKRQALHLSKSDSIQNIW